MPATLLKKTRVKLLQFLWGFVKAIFVLFKFAIDVPPKPQSKPVFVFRDEPAWGVNNKTLPDRIKTFRLYQLPIKEPDSEQIGISLSPVASIVGDQGINRPPIGGAVQTRCLELWLDYFSRPLDAITACSSSRLLRHCDFPKGWHQTPTRVLHLHFLPV